MFDPEKFGTAMAEAIRAAVAPLEKQLADLAAWQQATVGIVADLQRMIKNVPTLDEMKAKLAEIERLPGPAGPAGPAGERGLPGADGKNPTPAELTEIVTRAVAALPPAAAGPAGPAGERGADGKSVTLADVAPVVNEAVTRAVAALPAPAPGPVGPVGPAGERGLPGADGIGLAGFMIDRDGSLQATNSKGEVTNLGKVVGADGISLDAFELEYAPETHEVLLRATVGTRVKEIRYPAGGIRPAGYWRVNAKAKTGEAWTYGGALYIALRETDVTPDVKSDHWQLAARRGKDGDNVVRTVKPAGPIPLGA